MSWNGICICCYLKWLSLKIQEDFFFWNDEYNVYIHRLRLVQQFLKDPICNGLHIDLGCAVLSICILKSPP